MRTAISAKYLEAKKPELRVAYEYQVKEREEKDLAKEVMWEQLGPAPSPAAVSK